MIWPATRARIPRILSPRSAVGRSVCLGNPRRFFSEKNDIFTLDIDIEQAYSDDQKHPAAERQQPGDFSNSAAAAESSEQESDTFEDLFASSENTDALSGLDSIFQDMAEERPEYEAPPPRSGPRDVLREEADLFSKIFTTYSKTGPVGRPNTLQNQVLSTLKDSFTMRPENAANNAGSSQALSEGELKSLYAETADALGPTLAHIEGIATRAELEAFARGFLGQFRQHESRRGFYLRKLRNESAGAYSARQQQMCTEVAAQSSASPANPPLNATTMPVVFNRIVSVASGKFRDGALALTFFNAAKEDLHLYTVVCNQQTYNEMLKVHWLYFGKASLCEVELLVVEMMNNGFSGNHITFAVLREILSTYHTMRNGRSIYNPGGAPLWSREDDQRARNIGDKLETLGRQLRKERW